MKGVPASSGGRAATPTGPSPQAVSGTAGIPNANEPLARLLCEIEGRNPDSMMATAGDGAGRTWPARPYRWETRLKEAERLRIALENAINNVPIFGNYAEGNFLRFKAVEAVRTASVDTHPKGGNSPKSEVPFMSGAVAEHETPKPHREEGQ